MGKTHKCGRINLFGNADKCPKTTNLSIKNTRKFINKQLKTCSTLTRISIGSAAQDVYELWKTVNAKAEIKIGKQSLIRPQKKIPVSANILEKIVYIGRQNF